jgi:hypothetical protein
MSYKLDGVDIATYGLVAGVTEGNTALKGCWDLPKRIGDTYYSWGDENGVEPYVEADDILFGGRDLVFTAVLPFNNFDVYYKLKPFYAQLNAVTGLTEFETPYGTFNVQIASVEEQHTHAGGTIKVNMREPSPSLTGGSYPASGDAAYTMDGIPLINYGLYISESNGAYGIGDLKEQNFTKYGSEGFQIVKHNFNELSLNGAIFASDINDFNAKIKALYLAFSDTGKRLINKNNEVIVECFLVDGFTVSEVFVANNLVAAKFSTKLIITSFVEGENLLYEDGVEVVTEDSENITV